MEYRKIFKFSVLNYFLNLLNLAFQTITIRMKLID